MSIHTTGVPIFSSVSDTQVIDISNTLGDVSSKVNEYTTDIVLMGDEIALQKYTSVNSSLSVSDGVQANTFFQASDDRVKHNEVHLNNVLPIIMQLMPKKYDKTTEMLEANFNGNLDMYDYHKEAGFIAQEVMNIPELAYCVTGGDYLDENNNVVPNKYAVNYQNINIYAIQAIKELNQKLEALRIELQNNNII